MVGFRWFVFLAAVSGFMSVGIGALGAHSLPQRLRSSGLSEVDVLKKIDQCEIAVKYQMYHSLAILALGLAPATQSRGSWKASCFLFLIGMSLFSGGLYSMVFFNAMGHWSIVPLGGAIMMLAWLFVAIGALFPGKSGLGTGEIGTKVQY